MLLTIISISRLQTEGVLQIGDTTICCHWTFRGWIANGAAMRFPQIRSGGTGSHCNSTMAVN